MQRHFDEQMQILMQRLLLMGRLAESMVQTAVRALVEHHPASCTEVQRKEQEVNNLQIEIDELALTLTALQQPVGTDIRFLFMASRIATELERIGDQAINVCQNIHHVTRAAPLKTLVDLPLMGEAAAKMVCDSLDALAQKDCSLAERVLRDEHRVDAFRDQIFRVLLTYMMEDPRTIERALALILIARNLERVGDHATNISEEVIYLVEGREVRHRHESDSRRADVMQSVARQDN